MRKRLGQHFLYNQKILRRIADALSLQPEDMVIEIGPGRAALSRLLLQTSTAFVAIEKDRNLAQAFARNFQFPISNFQTNSKSQIPNAPKFIVQGDALQVLPFLDTHWKLGLENWKLVGNIPYYITGKLFRVIGEMEHKPKITVLMIQKEVAERVSAKPPHMNLLAASVQIWADVERLCSVSKREFKPMPKVESAVIKLKVVSCKLTERERDEYYKLIKILFKQPRKTILNNLCDGTKRRKEEILPILRKLGLDEHSRPQMLSIELITKLREML